MQMIHESRFKHSRGVQHHVVFFSATGFELHLKRISKSNLSPTTKAKASVRLHVLELSFIYMRSPEIQMFQIALVLFRI